MDEGDRWVYLDGPEPDHVRPVLAVLRRVQPATPEDDARFEREFFERLDAETAGGPEPPEEDEEDEESAASTKPRPRLEPATEGSATARSPVLDDRAPAPDPAVTMGAAAPIPPALADRAPAPPLVLEIAPPAPAPPPAPPPPIGVPRPPARLAGTAPLPPEARIPKVTLPFVLPEQVPEAKRGTRTQPVPVMKRPGLAATAGVGDDANSGAVAAMPFPGIPAAVARFPSMNVDGYASLRAELLVYPGSAEEIRAKYSVWSKPAQAALDADWAARFAVEAGLWAAFGAKFWQHVEWLRWQRG
jgi:hypothetical protein